MTHRHPVVSWALPPADAWGGSARIAQRGDLLFAQDFIEVRYVDVVVVILEAQDKIYM
jgi:hypothetical protein